MLDLRRLYVPLLSGDSARDDKSWNSLSPIVVRPTVAVQDGFDVVASGLCQHTSHAVFVLGDMSSHSAVCRQLIVRRDSWIPCLLALRRVHVHMAGGVSASDDTSCLSGSPIVVRPTIVFQDGSDVVA